MPSDVGRTMLERTYGCGRPSALDAAQRHPELGLAARLGQFLDRLAVPVTTQEIHATVHPRGVALQHLLHQADRLEVLRPVEGGAEPKTGDGVRHRDLRRRLI